MASAAIKRINDLANRVLRNIPYPIIRKIKDFPRAKDVQDGFTLLLVARPKDIWNAMWAAYSFCIHHPNQYQIKLIIDGKCDQAEKHIFQNLFENSKLIEKTAYISEVCAKFNHDEGYVRFIHNQPFARKLAAVVHESQAKPLLYIDSDILFFKTSPEIQSWMADSSRVFYLEDPPWCDTDPWLIPKLNQSGIPYRKGLNAGFLTIPKGILPVDLVCEIFADWHIEDMNWTTDQILFSSILLSKNAKPLDSDRYLNNSIGYFLFGSRSKINSDVVLRHYIGPIRRLLYTQGMPLVCKQFKNAC